MMQRPDRGVDRVGVLIVRSIDIHSRGAVASVKQADQRSLPGGDVSEVILHGPPVVAGQHEALLAEQVNQRIQLVPSLFDGRDHAVRLVHPPAATCLASLSTAS